MANKLRHTSDEPRNLSFQLIKQITNDFDPNRILGKGSFGTVYKGVHENDDKVAVKMFHENMLGDNNTEFQKEFQNLRRLKHPNVVALVGFCDEAENEPAEFEGKQVNAEKLHTALCYEYVDNGSLRRHISDENSGLPWKIRFKIIKGICEGLKYLNEGLDSPVMHLDLKPDNILVDKNMVAKVSDFGLSKLFGNETTRKTASLEGTVGYMPPEYIERGVISEKNDIFSLGVIIIKIMTGNEDYPTLSQMTPKKLSDYVHNKWKKMLHEKFRPPKKSLEVCCQQIRTCIDIASQCIKRNRHERPTIQFILAKLIDTETMIGDTELNIEQSCVGESILRETPSPGKTQESNSLHSILPKQLPFQFLSEITDGFSDKRKICESAYGAVYKGVLQDGAFIAVKKLHHPKGILQLDDDMIFQEEVGRLMAIQHENIVKLVSFCYEEQKEVVQYEGRYIIAYRVHRLLCYEYVPNGSLDDKHIFGEAYEINWDTRFKIIKGICNGLHFIHKEMGGPMVHMSLNPSCILLDENMEPKIDDFGLSRLFKRKRTRGSITNIIGHRGYMAPEYLYQGETSLRCDIYNLGILILEIATGVKSNGSREDLCSRNFVDNVRKTWTVERIASEYRSLLSDCLQEIRLCIEVGLECAALHGRNRPSIEDVVKKLNVRRVYSEPALNMPMFLGVKPQQLCFPFERKKEISSSLLLNNNGNDHVAFMIVANCTERFLTKLPLCGTVPPGCIYTLTVTMHKQARPPSDSGEFFTLHSIIADEDQLQDVEEGSIAAEYEKFFNDAKHGIQKVILPVTFDPPAEGTPSQPTRSTVETITTTNAQEVSSIDVHPTEPWIMTTRMGGILRVWNYHKMAPLHSFNPISEDDQVHVAKFIARQKWIVAGDGKGYIHIYSYDQHEEVNSFRAHDSPIRSLAVHPTLPFVLSASNDEPIIKLWDWRNELNDCEPTRAFHIDRVTQVVFNPEDTVSFATTSLDGPVKIWNVHSGDVETLKGDDKYLKCVNYFRRKDRQHLITCCENGIAKVWDLGKDAAGCIEKIGGNAEHICAVYGHPELPVVITGSEDGTVRLWNSTTFKVESILCFDLGAVHSFGFIKGFGRIVVACQHGIAMTEISMPCEVDVGRRQDRKEISAADNSEGVERLTEGS